MNTRLEGGCQVPIGSYAELKDGELWLRALVGAPDGSRWCAANDAGQRNKRKPSASRWRKSFWIMAPARFSRRFMMEKPRDEHPGHSSTTARGEALVSRLRAMGRVAWSFPLIEFTPGRELPALGDALARTGARRSAICAIPACGGIRPCPSAAAGPALAHFSALFCHWPHDCAGPAYGQWAAYPLPVRSGN